MPMDLVLKALDKAADLINLRVTRKGHLFVAKHIPDLASAVMAGKVWTVMDLASVTILDAPPTTTAGLTVQNPAGNKKVYVVFALNELVDVNPAAITSWTIWHCAHKLAVVPYARDLDLKSTGAGAICGLKAGQGAYPGDIILDQGATVADDGWTPAIPFASNVANSQADIHRSVALLVPVVIPPGFHYSLTGVGGSTTTEMGLGLVWGEFDPEELE